jgi:L-ascorbate metabolism protein UlaG (beta-lactamase superfamily)
MGEPRISITHIGGPTVLLEIDGIRLLTDPTFDRSGHEYPTSAYTLRKLADPAIAADGLGPIDVVLLSHDHHFDNLDISGREVMSGAGRVLTTTVGADRLKGAAVGMNIWESVELTTRTGRNVRITATPARHGPEGHDRGPVIGFALQAPEVSDRTLYISGDTVWFSGIEEVERRFEIRTAILFMGAAQVAAAGPWPLTFTADEGVQFARKVSKAEIIPIHCEGWEHFTETQRDIERAFRSSNLANRLRWLIPGVPTDIEL